MHKTFSTPPSAWKLYPGVLLSRKPALLPPGQELSRLEVAWSPVRVDADHLAAYRAVCGCARAKALPIAYPHVLANSLHMVLLSSDRFPVRIMGLVHIANRIRQQRPVGADEGGELRCWLEGHRESDKGQEFELHTEWRSADELLWSETSVFLARRRSPSKSSASSARGAGAALEGPARRTASFQAPVGLGRRYGWVSGDFNPIHMADVTARAFGFKAAIAHGMWSLARCAAEFGTESCELPCELTASFKLPVFLPSWLILQSSETNDGLAFEMRDSQGEKPHLSGRFTRRR